MISESESFVFSEIRLALFNHIRLVDEADDPHLSLTLRTGKRVCLIGVDSYLRNVGQNDCKKI